MGAFAELALRYHNAGANVVPIICGEKVPPADVAWAAWQSRRQTPRELCALIRAHADTDIAIVLGQVSGGLIDIETDGKAGEKALRGLRLPPHGIMGEPPWRSPTLQNGIPVSLMPTKPETGAQG